MSQNLHENHRERMRQRYLQQGADAFSTHELLEMLLYQSIPRGDTNGTAHALLEEHAGLEGVLFANTDDLCTTEGVGIKSAIMLGIVGELVRRCALENRPRSAVFDTFDKARRYVEPYYIGADVERVYVMMFDNGLHLIDFYLACEGTVNEAYPYARAIAERAVRKRAASVLIAHNHPNGFAVATAPDREFTHTVEQALKIFNINLLEHMLFADGECIGLLKKYAGSLRASPTNEDSETFFAKYYADMETGRRTLADMMGMENEKTE